ncbi:hypothetical protein [Photorhabdus sp. SF281]|uniref:hypothetical protein n=1 Tax=Photorhabdus sp. SF281 TaxID=3459527 RepID=UPI00404416C8
MSLESNLALNNELLSQQNVLLTQLLAALSNNNTPTPNTQPTPAKFKNTKNKSEQPITDTEITIKDVNIDTLDLETVVALAVLFKDDAHTLTNDKYQAARKIIDAVGDTRNGRADALHSALAGLSELKGKNNSVILDLCLEILANWADIPGITERREFALELLSEGKIHTEADDDEAQEPEPVIDTKALLKEAETLILQLVKNGYRSEAVDILAKFDAKKLGQVAEKHLPEVVALAKAAMEG